MATVSTTNISIQICEALNIDPATVSKISVHFTPADVITATVTLCPTEEQMERIIEITSKGMPDNE